MVGYYASAALITHIPTKILKLSLEYPLRRFYKHPASLCGRNFDDKYVTLGWYTFAYEGGLKKSNRRKEENTEQTYENI